MNQQQIKEIANRCGLKGDEPWIADFVGLVLEAVVAEIRNCFSRGGPPDDPHPDSVIYNNGVQSALEAVQEFAGQSPAPIPEQAVASLSAEDAAIIARQVFDWTKERDRLQDLIDTATGKSGAPIPEQVAPKVDTEEFRVLLDKMWNAMGSMGAARARNAIFRHVERLLATQSAKQSNLQEENRQLRERIEDLTTAANQCINDALSQSAKQGAQDNRTYMDDKQAFEWAWAQVKNDVGTEGWTVGEHGNYFGFFLHGWRYGKQYERQGTTVTQAAPEQADSATLNRICDMFGIGILARSESTILANVRNTIRRAECLSAIEHAFFMKPAEPDEDFPDDDPGEECMLGWGRDPQQYVEQFRAALAKIAAPATQVPPNVRDQALEDAAQIALKEREEFRELAAKNNGRESDFAFGSVNSAERICNAIRAMKSTTEPTTKGEGAGNE